MIESMKENNSNKNVESWFTEYSTDELGRFYSASVVKSVFDKWITDGMIED